MATGNKSLDALLDKAPQKANEAPWSSLPSGGIIWVSRSRNDELTDLYALAKSEVAGELAAYDLFVRLQQSNADTLWSIYRASDSACSDAKLIGFYALIHLNDAGFAQLSAGRFDGLNPDFGMMVPSATRPAAIYVWIAVARGVARFSTWLLANALGAETYGGVPLFATAGTLGGLNLMKGYGFSSAGPDSGLGKLFRLDRGGATASNSTA